MKRMTELCFLKKLTITGMVTLGTLQAQVLYEADFSMDGVGSTHNESDDGFEMSPIAGANWSIFWNTDPASDGSTNSFITSGGALTSSDWGGIGSFETEEIDVSAESSLVITGLGETVGTSVFTGTAGGIGEHFQWYYILDGGARVLGPDITDDGSLDYSATVDVSSASTLVVGFTFAINGGGDGFNISRVVVGDSAVDSIGLSVSSTFLFESGTNPAAMGTVTRSGDTSSSLTLDLTSSDISELTVPDTVTIPAGAVSAEFEINVVDDDILDGDQVVTLTLSDAGGVFPDISEEFTVEDNEVPPAPDVIINEIHAAPNSDVNGDGVIGTGDDEFVELVNISDVTIDLSGWTLADGFSVRHVFPDGTMLDAGCAIVIFGGGEPVSISGAEVLIASTGALGLNNGGDTITLNNGVFDTISESYSGSTSGSSLNLDPDLTGTSYSDHSTIADALGNFSPGAFVNGDPFCGDDILLLTFSENSISENAGMTTATIRRTGDTAGVVTINLTASPAGDVTVPTSVTILDGAESVDFTITGVDNAIVDSSRDVLITATDVAAGFATVSGEITVTDDEPVVLPQVVLNEIDPDTPGNDGLEFIELFAAPNFSLDGVVAVLINGSGETVYDVIDLAGQMTDANGYFIIGDAAVPGVNLTPEGWNAVNSDIQNGVDAVALYVGSADDFQNGQAANSTNIIDVIMYDSSGMETDSDLAAALGLTTVDTIFEDANGDRENHSLNRFPNESGSFQASLPSVGGENSEFVAPVTPVLSVLSCTFDPSTGVGQIVIAGSGINYDIVARNDLSLPVTQWVLITDTPTVTDNGDGTVTLDFTDSDGVNQSTRFYGVKEFLP